MKRHILSGLVSDCWILGQPTVQYSGDSSFNRSIIQLLRSNFQARRVVSAYHSELYCQVLPIDQSVPSHYCHSDPYHVGQLPSKQIPTASNPSAAAGRPSIFHFKKQLLAFCTFNHASVRLTLHAGTQVAPTHMPLSWVSWL